MADTRPAKRQRLTSRIVTVKVGTETTTLFSIHEDVLVKHSKFFEAALDQQWREGQTLVIELPEDDPEAFSAYAEWLYDRHRLPTALGRKDKPYSSMDKSQRDLVLAKTYVLGEKCLDAKFCNAIIDLLFKNVEQQIHDLEVVNILYGGTPPGSPARRFVIDIWMAERVDDDEKAISDGDEVPADFTRDLVKAFMAQTRVDSDDYVEPTMRKAWRQLE